MRVFNLLVQTNAPLNTSFNSPYVQLKSIFMYNINAIITGTPNGILTLQASNDPETNDTQTNPITNKPPAVGPSNWVTIRSSNFTVTTQSENMWNVQGTAYNYVRVAYQDTSGGTSTATMDVIFNGKGM
jgi:hypothetical protein